MSEYIVQMCVYQDVLTDAGAHIDRSAESYALLSDIWIELRSQGRNLSQIARSADEIARDTRSFSSRRLAESLRAAVDEARPHLVRATGAAADALSSFKPRRR